MTKRKAQIAQGLISPQAFLGWLAIHLVGRVADDLVRNVWQRTSERPLLHGDQLRGCLARYFAANRWRLMESPFVCARLRKIGLTGPLMWSRAVLGCGVDVLDALRYRQTP